MDVIQVVECGSADLCIDKWESNQEPRFLTGWEDLMLESPTVRLSMVRLFNCCRVPIIYEKLSLSIIQHVKITIHWFGI